ncbi:MAG: hypothetical protein ABSG05_03415 [Candidatus Pacearchaeota archaeon]|jgi:hypothetical protein
MGERFERFKLDLHNKIKQGTIESNLNGERVLMKYGGWHIGFFDLRTWHVINPPVVEENGKLKMNWPNFIFGGWKNLWKLVGVIIVFGAVLLSYSNIVNQFNHLVKTCTPYSVNLSAALK